MDKMRHFNEFFASYLRFCVLDLCFFCNGIQRRSAYYCLLFITYLIQLFQLKLSLRQ
jgi:hypothetical protein